MLRQANRFGIGAEIEVHAGGLVQRQFVSAGSDFMTQQSGNRYFGLSDATVVDSVVVRWREATVRCGMTLRRTPPCPWLRAALLQNDGSGHAVFGEVATAWVLRRLMPR